MENLLKQPRLDSQSPDSKASLLSKLLVRYKSSAETEHEQATLRLIITIIGVFYLWSVTKFNYIGSDAERFELTELWSQWWWPSAYFSYALAHAISIVAHPKKLLLRRVLMVVADNFAITLLVFQGSLLNPFVAFYFWIAIGYGFRYGSNWLAYSGSISMLCFLLLFCFVPVWNSDTALLFPIALSLGIALGYTYCLLKRLKLVQHKLTLKAQELEKLATKDSLTGLANRALLMDRLTHAINLATRSNRDIALFFIDVDGLKMVNDQVGHAAGDALLTEVAKTLQVRLRAVDTCARIAGDEFIVVLEGEVERNNTLNVADTMLKAIYDLTIMDQQQFRVSASIGIAWLSSLPENERTPDALLAAADSAMYTAKKSGGNRYSLA